MRWILVLLVCSHLPACNGDTEATDSGQPDDGGQVVDADAGPGDPGQDAGEEDGGASDGFDAGSDDAGGDDAGADDGGPADSGNGDCQGPDADLDPGEDFGLWVPACTQACTYHIVDTDDYSMSLLLKARVTLNSGMFLLPKDLRSFEADLIESLEVGPDGDPATPNGPGIFTLSVSGSGAELVYGYQFSQPFLAGVIPLNINVSFEFEAPNDVPQEEVITIGEETLTNQTVYVTGWVTSYSMAFSSCLYTMFDCLVHNVTMDDGSTLRMEQCNLCPPTMICKADPGALVQSRFVKGAEERYVNDHFRLAHSMRHHNWGADYLVVFDRPVGLIHAVYLGSENFPSLLGAQVDYLDSAWQVIETHTVSDYFPDTEW